MLQTELQMETMGKNSWKFSWLTSRNGQKQAQMGLMHFAMRKSVALNGYWKKTKKGENL